MICPRKPINLFQSLAVVSAALFLLSCGPKAQYPLSRLDTPERHTFTGIRLLDQGKWVDARREFELALRLDPNYAKAYVGIGLVRAGQKEFTGGFDALEQAEKRVRSDEEKLFLRVGAIRLNTMRHSACLDMGTGCKPDEEWLKRSKEAFDQAMLIDPKAAAPCYFMGEAYLAAGDPERAGAMFRRVLELNDAYVEEADDRLRRLQKMREKSRH